MELMEELNLQKLKRTLRSSFGFELLTWDDPDTDTIKIQIKRKGVVQWTKAHSRRIILEMYHPEHIYWEAREMGQHMLKNCIDNTDWSTYFDGTFGAPTRSDSQP